MLCPSCKTPLSIADRAGIEIDYCPACRGVWLERGELDKIIERSAAAMPQPTQEAWSPDRRPEDRRWDDHRPEWRHGDHGRHGDYRRRRKSFLSEIFDFD